MPFGYFNFNGRSSREFNLFIVYEDGENNALFGINRDASIEIISKAYHVLDHGFEYSPLSFPIRFWSEKPLSREKRIELCRWLFTDSFGEFYTEEEPDIIWYCKFIDETERFMAIQERGYISCTTVCDSPFAWSRPMTQKFDLKDFDFSSDSFKFVIRNDSNYNNWYHCWFKIIIPENIESVSDIEYSICNRTNTSPSDAFVISSSYGTVPLQRNETLQVDIYGKNLYTDYAIGLGNMYGHRINNCNRKFIDLDYGENQIEFIGNCLLEVTVQYPVLN